MIESCGEQLIELLLAHSYRVILRPHHETVKQDPELLAKMDERFAGPDFTLEQSVESDDSIFKSDFLVSDVSGISLEYAFGTERPVIFMDVPRKVRNEEYEQIGIEPLEISIREKIGVVVNRAEIDSIPDVLIELERTR